MACCSHSYCTVYSDDPSGRCPAHREYVVYRQATPDSPRDYYRGSNLWSSDPSQAKRFPGESANILCENLTVRGYGMTYLFSPADYRRSDRILARVHVPDTRDVPALRSIVEGQLANFSDDDAVAFLRLTEEVSPELTERYACDGMKRLMEKYRQVPR